MKKTIFITFVLILVLAACGSNTPSTPENNPSAEFDPNTRELPLSTKLAIGTLKLEGTAFAVSADQAADLLPLWRVLDNLSSSDSAAPEEITAITEQIQESMTADQIAAIDDMGLTGDDIFAAMQELGLENAPQVNAQGTPQPGSGFGGRQGQGGEFPGAGPGGGGGPGGGLDGQNLSPDQIATAQARREENGGGGFGNRLVTPMIESVIDLLQSKAQ